MTTLVAGRAATTARRHLDELGTRGGGGVRELLDEPETAHELRHDDVVPGREVGPSRGQDHRAGEPAGALRVPAPAADEVAQPVDVQVEGERVIVDEHPRQRRLARRRRAVEQHQPRHAGEPTDAGCPLPGEWALRPG